MRGQRGASVSTEIPLAGQGREMRGIRHLGNREKFIYLERWESLRPELRADSRRWLMTEGLWTTRRILSSRSSLGWLPCGVEKKRQESRQQACGGGKVQSRKACWPPGPGGAEGKRRRGWILEDDEVVWTRPGEMGGGGRGSLSLQI